MRMRRVRCVLAGTALGFIATVHAAVTNFPFVETFEHGGALPAGWTSEPASGVDAWTATTGGIDAPDGDHTTGSGYFLHADGWDHSPTASVLNLPALDLSAVTNPAVTYWFAIGDEEASGKQSYLYFEAFHTSGWVQVGARQAWSPHGWIEVMADLAPYRSTNAQFRFRATVPSDVMSAEDVCVDDVTVFAATNAPEAPSNLSPADGATGVPVFATLRWEKRAIPTGYRLYAGTDGGGTVAPTNLLNGVVLPGAASRRPLDDLAPDTTYYWRLVPFNAHGTNETAPIRHFRTGGRTTITSFPVTEAFEHAGATPPGWIDRYDDDGTGWFYNDFYADHTTGAGYYTDIDVEYQNPVTPLTNHLVSPRFDLSATAYPKLSFWYNKGAANNYLELLVFHHGGWHANRLLLRSGSTAGWTNEIVDLAPYKSADLRIAFRGIERGWWDGDLSLGLDDITLYDDTLPPGPTTPVSPADQATGVMSRGEIRWQPAARADNYILFFGTDGGGSAPPTNLANGLALGNTTVRAFTNLAYGTAHYWQIVPSNLIGPATNCPIWRFTTMDALSPLPFADGFETGLAAWVASPAGSGTLTASGEECHEGASAARATAHASGMYNLANSTLTRTFGAAADPQLAFWYRVTPGDFAELSVDIFDGQWSNGVWSGTASSWTEVIVDLRRFDTEGGEFMVRFNLTAAYVNFGGPVSQTVYLDDIRLLAAGGPPLPPHTPVPADGATNVPVTTLLQWSEGMFTDASAVYCSTNGAAVSNALAEARVIAATTNTLVPPGFLLQSGATYYWRTLATNAFGANTGPVWRLTAATPQILPVPYTQTFGAGIPAAFELTTNTWSAIRWSAGIQSPLSGPADGGIAMEGGGEDVMYWQPGDLSQIWNYAEQDGLNWRNTARMVLHLTSTGGPHRLQFDYRMLRNLYDRDVNLRIDVNTGEGWRQVGGDFYPTDANTNWTRATLDLGALPAGLFALRFWSSVKYAESVNGQGVYIDNLAVDVPPAAPAPPYGPHPADGEPAAFVDGPLSWNNGAGTASIDLYFSGSLALVTSLDASARVLSDVATNAFDPPDPPRSVMRYWRVVAHGAGGTLATGTVWSFMTQPEALKALPYATGFATNPWAHAWTQAGDWGAAWNVADTASAGGAAPEMACSFGTGTGVVRLVSPPLATTGTPWLAVSFRHRLDLDETGGYGPLVMKIQSSADAETWTDEIVRQPVADEGPTNLQYTLAGNLGATTYVAFALVGDLRAFNEWFIDDAAFSNATAAPPPQPAYAPFPEDGARTVLPDVDLAWSNAPGTATVDLYFHTNRTPVASLDASALRLSNQAAASFDPGPLVQGRTHYWCVVSRNAAGQTATGAVWRFRVRSAALKPLAYWTDFSADAWDEAWTQQMVNCDAPWFAVRDGPMCAGGEAPEMMVSGDTASGAVTRLVSPPLDTHGASALVVTFRSALGWFFVPPADAELAVQSSANGIDWIDEAAWNATSAPPASVRVRNNLGGTTWLAWTLRGDLEMVHYWAIDDVLAYEPVFLAIERIPGAFRLLWEPVGSAAGYAVESCRDPVAAAWSNEVTTSGTAWTNGVPSDRSLFRVRALLLFEDP